MANSLRKSIAVLGLSLMFSMGPWLQGYFVGTDCPGKRFKSGEILKRQDYHHGALG
jgi:hypothetical protein